MLHLNAACHLPSCGTVELGLETSTYTLLQSPPPSLQLASGLSISPQHSRGGGGGLLLLHLPSACSQWNLAGFCLWRPQGIRALLLSPSGKKGLST